MNKKRKIFSFFIYQNNGGNYDWKDTCIIYWQGEAIVRDSQEYDDMIDELYTSAIQNPLYRHALINCDKYIMHSIEDANKEDTLFTRYEFEKQLNCLKDFLKCNN